MTVSKELIKVLNSYEYGKKEDLQEWLEATKAINKDEFLSIIHCITRQTFDGGSNANYKNGTLEIFTSCLPKVEEVNFYLGNINGLKSRVLEESVSTVKKFVDSYDKMLDRLGFRNKPLHWERHMVGFHLSLGILNEKQLHEEFNNNLLSFLSRMPSDDKMINVLQNMDYLITKNEEVHQKFLKFTKINPISSSTPFSSFVEDLVVNKLKDSVYLYTFDSYVEKKAGVLEAVLEEFEVNMIFNNYMRFLKLDKSLPTNETKKLKNKV